MLGALREKHFLHFPPVAESDAETVTKALLSAGAKVGLEPSGLTAPTDPFEARSEERRALALLEQRAAEWHQTVSAVLVVFGWAFAALAEQCALGPEQCVEPAPAG